MKKVLIAFDIDGTLRNNAEAVHPLANEEIRTLLILLSKFKNVKIMVWSGGGELYARQMASAFALQKYVDCYGDKKVIGCAAANCPNPDESHWHFGTELRPDICIDDIQSFGLGLINLICKQK